MDGDLHLEIEGPIARLIIDRAAKRNAMTTAMFEALPVLIADAVANPAIRVIVLQSAAPGMFCAGADIGELAANAGDPIWCASNQVAINRAVADLAGAPKPVVAFVDGDGLGAGCGLALACDIRIATPRARFGITPGKLGLVYPFRDTKRLVDLVGPGQAKRILFTATLIDAAEALRIGLIDLIADSPGATVDAIAASSTHTTRESKAIIQRILDGQTADDAETLRTFVDAFAGPDFTEGVAAFLAKRKPAFE